MIKIVKAEKPLVPFPGEIGVYGGHHKYMVEMDWSDIDSMNPMPLVGSCSFSYNPWAALVAAGIDIEDIQKLRDLSKNHCPCSTMDYNAIVPIAILTNDASVYTNAGRMPEMFHGLHEDGDWNRRSWTTNLYEDGEIVGCEHNKSIDYHLSDVERAMLGSGYTEMILPSDGSHGLIFATIPLDNGDKIVVIGWEWYNK